MNRFGLALAAGLAFTGWAESAPAVQAVTPVDTQALIRTFYAQVGRCWSPPPKAGAAKVVQLEIHLDTNGRLVGEPELLSKFDTTETDVEAWVMSAKAALHACAPYKLPANQYQYWRDIIVTFDPRRL